MKLSTLVRLALAGTRTDALRMILTALSTTTVAFAVLGTATVAAIKPDGVGRAVRYTTYVIREPIARSWLVLALVAMSVPVLALAAQCGRLGAPGRDRRLAAIRLAGATPRQTVAVAVTEAGLASLVGTAVGLVGYLVVMRVAHRPDARERLPLPTDVRLGPWLLAALCLSVPLVTGAIAALLLRKVAANPFGVARQVRPDRPHWWPLLFIAAGLALPLLSGPVVLAPLLGSAFSRGGLGWLVQALPWQDQGAPEMVGQMLYLAIPLGTVLCAAAGVGLSVGWISVRSGALLHRFARRPATLIAGRRLMTDPWSGSRTLGTLFVAVLLGAGAAGLRSYLSAVDAQRRDYTLALDSVVGATTNQDYRPAALTAALFSLVDAAVAVAMVIAGVALLVALVERILAHRRASAALVAAGVPRSTLGLAALWQAVVPAVPALILAAAVGIALPRLAFGGGLSIATREVCVGPVPGDFVQDGGQPCFGNPGVTAVHQVMIPGVSHAVAVPWAHLALLATGGMALVVAMVGVSLLLLRTSTDLAELRTA